MDPAFWCYLDYWSTSEQAKPGFALEKKGPQQKWLGIVFFPCAQQNKHDAQAHNHSVYTRWCTEWLQRPCLMIPLPLPAAGRGADPFLCARTRRRSLVVHLLFVDEETKRSALSLFHPGYEPDTLILPLATVNAWTNPNPRDTRQAKGTVGCKAAL
ncbi:hypothetical protein LZ30DRAFT_336943 [Colletotrichum cereale]|nr:hypothetical protein LZ30DRAFT_336943 [Colletotrichum cereale]